MAVAEINVIPLGTGTSSLSKYVARAIKVLQQEKDLKYEINSMGTIIEGDLDKILAVAKKMHEAAFSEELTRVETIIKIDDRRDKTLSMSGKVESLKEKLGY